MTTEQQQHTPCDIITIKKRDDGVLIFRHTSCNQIEVLELENKEIAIKLAVNLLKIVGCKITDYPTEQLIETQKGEKLCLLWIVQGREPRKGMS